MSDKTEMKASTFVSAKCRIEKVDHKVALTINWEGIQPGELQELAQRTIVHKAMSTYRTNGTQPPGELTIKAGDYTLGTRHVKEKMTPEQMLASLSPEDRAALIAKFINS